MGFVSKKVLVTLACVASGSNLTENISAMLKSINYSQKTLVALLQYVPKVCIIKTISAWGGHYIRRCEVFRQIRHYAP
jgi:hypothetical protein